jgi:uncharacterized protein YndB with AHSA1/START domain
MTDRYGDLDRLEDGSWQLRFERRLPQPQATVWRALTDDHALAAWFPTTIEGERRAGAPLHFAHHNAAEPGFDGEVLAYEPESLFELRWGDDVVRLELRAAGETASVLTLRHTFAERGKGARDGAGWHVCLDRLEAELGGAEAATAWRELQPRYAERFGPEAATIGPPESANV